MSTHAAVGSAVTSCPGCGLGAPVGAGPVLEDHGASAGCRAAYGEVLARSYGDPGRRTVHQVLVDAYAAQHAPRDARAADRRQVQQVALCLMTLGLVVADGVDPREGPALHKRMVARRPDFHWLEPPPRPEAPSGAGSLTVGNVLGAGDAVEHRRLVLAWGAEVWRSWAAHHATVRAWNSYALSPH